MILLILLILILILHYYVTMHHFFSYSKSVDSFINFISPSNNLSSLFLTSSFNLSILFIFSFPDNPNSLSLPKFFKILHLSIRVVKSTSKFSEILFFSSSYLTFIFNFLFVSFFISFISCSFNDSSFCISFNVFLKLFSSFLNSSVIINFFESVKKRGLFCFSFFSLFKKPQRSRHFWYSFAFVH